MQKLRICSNQWMLLLAGMLFLANMTRAGDGVGRREIPAGGGGPTIKAMVVLDGSLHQIKADSSRTALDSTFFDPSLAGQIDSSYSVQNVVTLRINEASTLYLRSAFTVTVKMRIGYTSRTGDTASVIRSFTVNYDSAHSYNSRSSFAFSGAHRVTVTVLSVDPGATVSWDPTSVLVIENQMLTRPVFSFGCSNTVGGITVTPVADTADELPVSWTEVLGADQYDLEWTYIDTNALRNHRYGNPLNPDLLFRNNSTRASITGTSYRIPLIFVDSGTLFIRVRPVQLKGVFTVIPAIWSSEASPSVMGQYAFIGHQRSLNWQADISFAEGGKNKVVVGYYDGYMLNRQLVTKDNTTDNIIVSEKYYDYQGRTAVEVMPAPSLDNVIRYTSRFNVAGGGAEYTQSNYDSLPDPSAFCSIHADSMSNSTGASRYFSPNNPVAPAGLNQFIPDAHNYPFAEREYLPDNSERISRQGGVGPDHQLGSGRETKYFYGTPDQNELDALFGTEVGDKSHYFKDMVRDANGQYSVSYTDMHGRLIATALAGATPAGMAALASNTGKTLTETLADTNSVYFDDLSMISQKSLLVPIGQNYHFNYNLNPSVFNEANCQTQNLCYTCRYDLEVTITDNCNNQLLPGHKPYDTVLHNFSPLAAYNDSCLTTPIGLDFTIPLLEGSYIVTKKLTVNRDYFNWYRDSVYIPANTCRTLQQFIDSMKAINVAYNPSCAPNCSACRASIGTWDAFWTKYKASGGLGGSDTAAYQAEAMTAYNNALSACNALCGDSASDDNDLLNAMLQDVTPPFGQYADSSLAANSDKYSIFYIPPGDTVNYVPVFQLPGLQYLDGNGKLDSVYNSTADLMVDPNSLTMDQFVQNFRSSWAYALLPYHPEYCKLIALQGQKASSIWDRKMESVDNFADANSQGYLNPTGSGASPFSHFTPQPGNTDPLMAVPKIKTDLEAKMNVYQPAQGGNPPLSMWALACLMVKCGSGDQACIVTYSDINNDFNPSTMCEGDRDMAWRNFRQLYLDAKHDFLYTDLLDNPSGCSPTNSRAYGQTPSAEVLYAAYHMPEFSDGHTRLNRSSLQDFLNVGGPTQAQTLATKSQATLDSFYTANSNAYVSQWTQQLSHCIYYSDAGMRDSILPRLVALCRMACDTAHPYGASSLPTGMTYTPAGTTYSFTSFQDILDAYNAAHGITDVVNCNAELLVAPQPYGNQPIYGNKPVYNKPTDCECTTINSLHNSFVAHPQGYASFSLYLKNTLQVSLTDAELNQLLAMCNNTATPGCTYLPQPIMLPPAMQCNSGNTCASCTLVASVYQNYLARYPGNAPAPSMNVDTTQAKKNLLFQNYMNNRLGFNLQASDYLQFMDSCTSYANGGGGGTGGNPGAGISCDSLTKIRKWFYTLYPVSMGDMITTSKFVPVKKVYHITQPYQNEFDDNGNLFWFADTTYATYAANSLAGLGAATWTNGAWYKDRDNIIFDFSKLPINITVNAATMNLYAKDSALEMYTGHGAHFRRIADPFYGIFQRALSPVTPGVTTWSSQPSVTTTNGVTIPTISIPNAYMTTHPSSVQMYSNQDYTGVSITGLAKDMYQASLNNSDYGMMFRLSNDTLGTYAMYMFWAGLASTPAGKNPNMNMTFSVGRGDLFTWFVDSVLQTTYTSSQIDSLYLDACGSSSGQYGGLEGPLLCGKSSPVFPPAGTDSVTSCTDSTFFSVSKGTALYNGYVDSLKGDFEQKYLAKCLQAYRNESFTVTHMGNEYNYTLYYYNQAGDLVKTVLPAGVAQKTDTAWLDSVRTARAAGQLLTPHHTMVTQYRYNTLDEVVAQHSPDVGTIDSWYDMLGRLVISQNARQRDSNQYSYNLFDSLGRIIQVGQLVSSAPVTDAITRTQAALQTWENAVMSSAGQITTTTYDEAPDAILPELSPRNLRNRVSWMALYNTYADMAAVPAMQVSATYFSYDILGNTDTVVQDFKLGSMAVNGNRFKKVVYDYDLLGGTVNHLSYQHGFADAFYSDYTFDKQNRLTNVLHSTDSVHWDNDAYYSYYGYGPLARIVLGQQQVQGINYAFTLQGWLKAINPGIYTGGSFTLRPDSSGNIVAANAYNLALGYYNGDYSPISGAPGPDYGVSTTLGTSDYRPLYNGYAGTMALNLRNIGNPLLYNYQYDQLYRLVNMDAWKRTGTDWSAISKVPDFQESIAYDENGNIKGYKRNGNNSFSGQPLGMDSLNYFYVPGTNRLDHVTDSVPAGNYTTDIDGQMGGNYQYDSLGQMISDNAAGITHIGWTAYGRIGSINKTGDTTILYTYSPAGLRISRSVIHGTDTLTTWYVRDASGNVLSVYTYGDPAVRGKDLTQTELHMYGAHRLGVLKMDRDVALDAPVISSSLPLLGTGDSLIFIRGNKLFELTNNVENVLGVISDKRYGVSNDDSTVAYFIPDVTEANDYYPFGSPEPGRTYVQANAGYYRYGMNGQERSDEISGAGNSYTAEFWEYDPRLGRRWNVDMVVKPWESPYATFADNPINLADPDGDEAGKPESGGGNGSGTGTSGGPGTPTTRKPGELEEVLVTHKKKKKKVPEERPHYPVWTFPGQKLVTWQRPVREHRDNVIELSIADHTGPFGLLNRTSIWRLWGPWRYYYNSTPNGDGGFFKNMTEIDLFAQISWGHDRERWVLSWFKEKWKGMDDFYRIEAQTALQFGYGRLFYLGTVAPWVITDQTTASLGIELGKPLMDNNSGPVNTWGPHVIGYYMVGFGGSVITKVQATYHQRFSIFAAASLHHAQLWGQKAPGSAAKPMGLGSLGLSLGVSFTIVSSRNY